MYWHVVLREIGNSGVADTAGTSLDANQKRRRPWGSEGLGHYQQQSSRNHRSSKQLDGQPLGVFSWRSRVAGAERKKIKQIRSMQGGG
jgi:hypothetical protein